MHHRPYSHSRGGINDSSRSVNGLQRAIAG
jgi:hypothetical protein